MGCTTKLCTRATAVPSLHGRAVRHIVSRTHGASAHFYADDGQLYVNSLAADTDDAINCLQACVAAVDEEQLTAVESTEDAADMARVPASTHSGGATTGRSSCSQMDRFSGVRSNALAKKLLPWLAPWLTEIFTFGLRKVCS